MSPKKTPALRALLLASTAACAPLLLAGPAQAQSACAPTAGPTVLSCGNGLGGTIPYGDGGVNVTVRQGATVTSPILINRFVNSRGGVQFTNLGTLTAVSSSFFNPYSLEIYGETNQPTNSLTLRNEGRLGWVRFSMGGTASFSNTGSMGGLVGSSAGDLSISNAGTITYAASNIFDTINVSAGLTRFVTLASTYNQSTTTDANGNRVVTTNTRNATDTEVVSTGKFSLSNAAGGVINARVASMPFVTQWFSGLGGATIENAGRLDLVNMSVGAGGVYSSNDTRNTWVDTYSPNNFIVGTSSTSNSISTTRVVAGDVSVTNRAGGVFGFSQFTARTSAGSATFTNEAGATVASTPVSGLILSAGTTVSNSENSSNYSSSSTASGGRYSSSGSGRSTATATAGSVTLTNGGAFNGTASLSATDAATVNNTGTITGSIGVSAGASLSDGNSSNSSSNSFGSSSAYDFASQSTNVTRAVAGRISVTNGQGASIGGTVSLSALKGEITLANAGSIQSLRTSLGSTDSSTVSSSSERQTNTPSGINFLSLVDRSSRTEATQTAVSGTVRLTNEATGTIGFITLANFADTAIVNDGVISRGIFFEGSSLDPTRSTTSTTTRTFRSESSSGRSTSEEQTSVSFSGASAGASLAMTNRGTVGETNLPGTGFLSLVGDGAVSLANSGTVFDGAWLSAGSRRATSQSSVVVQQTYVTSGSITDQLSRTVTTTDLSSTAEAMGGTVRLENAGTLGRLVAGPDGVANPAGSVYLEGRVAELANTGSVTLTDVILSARSLAQTTGRRTTETAESRYVTVAGSNLLRNLATTTTETTQERAETARGTATLRNSGSVQVTGGIEVSAPEAATLVNSGRLSGGSLFVGDRSEDTRSSSTTRVTQTRLDFGPTTRTSTLVSADSSSRTVSSVATLRNEAGGTLSLGSILLGGSVSSMENSGAVRVSGLGIYGSVLDSVARFANDRLVSSATRSLGGRASLANSGTVSGLPGGDPAILIVAADSEARLSNAASGTITGEVRVESLSYDTSATADGGTITTRQTRVGGLAALQQNGTITGPVNVLGFAQSSLANAGRITGAVTVGSTRLGDYDMGRGDALFADITTANGQTTRSLARPATVPSGVTLVGPSGLTSVIGTTQAALLGSAVLTNGGTITGAVGVGAYDTAYLENSGTIAGNVTLLANGTRILNNSGTITGTVTIGVIPTAQTVTAASPAPTTTAADTPAVATATAAVAMGPALPAAAAEGPTPSSVPAAAPTTTPAPAATPPLARIALPGLVSAEAQGFSLVADEAQPEAVTPAATPVAAATVPALPASMLAAPATVMATAVLPTPSASRSATAADLLATQNTALGTRVTSTGSIGALVAQGPQTSIQLSGTGARIGSLSFTGAGSSNTVTLSGGATVDSLTSLVAADGTRLATTSVTWDVAAGATPASFSGSMSGLTSFTKTGAGTLVLRGRVDATNLDVSAGQLGFAGTNAGVTGNFAVRSGGVFMPGVTPGQGTITLANGQLFATNADDMSVGGNLSLAQGGDYRVYVQPAFTRTATLGANGVPVGGTSFAVDTGARSSLVTVGGNATLAGGMTVMLNPYTLYRDGQTVDVMRVGGTLSTTGMTLGLGVSSPVITPLLRTRTVGTQTVLGVELDRRSYATVTGGAANGAAVGAALDGALVTTLGILAAAPGNATAQDMANLLTAFDFGFTAAQATAVAGDLDGEFYASLGALDFDRDFAQAGADRLDAEAGATPPGQTSYGGWVAFTGGKDELGERAGLSGINGDYRGVAVGMEARTPGGLLLGLMAGRGNTDVDSRGGLDTAKVESKHFGLYAGMRFAVGADDAVRFETQSVLSRNDIEATRRLPTLGRTATTDTEGVEGTARAKLSYDAVLNGGRTVLSPFAGLTYKVRGVDGFTESGANAVGLAVGSDNDRRLDGTLGLGARHAFTLGEVTTLTPSVTVAYRWQGDPGTTATARFLGGATAFDSRGLERDDGVDLNLGLSLKVGATFEAFAGYAGTLADDERATRVSAGIRARF